MKRPGHVILLILLSASASFSQPCTDNGIFPEEYAQRRLHLAEIMDSTAVLVMKTPEPATEFEYMNFRQDPDFLYLTGVDKPGYSLIIDPKGIQIGEKIFQAILFAPKSSLEGSSAFSSQESPYSLFEGKKDTVMDQPDFRKVFDQVLKGRKTLYYTAPGLTFLHDWVNDKPYFLEKEVQKSLKQRYPGLKMVKATSWIARLRQFKSAAELELLRKAIALTGDGIRQAMKTCKPGIWEYEIQAEVEYSMRKGGAERESFRSIIGAGINSLSPHYDENHCQAGTGELLVMDVGAEYHHYAADITRTIPVSGRFTPAQKTIYEAVLGVQKDLIALVRPGMATLKIDELANELITKAGYRKYIMHGVTHPLGLDVHDVSASGVLEEGMVITLEPGIYIPSNDTLLPADFRGFGIRIEDDILITREGNEVLSKDIPKEVADIERLMSKKK